MRVAVTGGIGEGKSTVLGIARALGRKVASSDEIARQVMALPTTQEAVSSALGYPIPPDREELRRRIATDPVGRRLLNQVTHPLILRAIEEDPAQIIEVPLLVEACLQGRFDAVWVVTCGEDVQEQRLAERYGSVEAARTLMATQLPTAVKMAFADEIIRTNRPLGLVSKDVAALIAALPAS